ncbi:alpha/beta hydrolase [Paroceanicella profunda]|uniref:Alpha/beta hydrolase n=1 Tax=Paroceanicella profunda TaxID=2579971 RepID=A0A5B8FH22_9RHOB|nr:alpha/beta hydrolase [Paroceanicella profunda]QDL91687.1 alpha/beta hydrolase [Paroceanicella profunda]
MKICVVTDIHDRPGPGACIASGLHPLPGVMRLSLSGLCGRPDLSGEALHRHLFQEGGMGEVVHALRRKVEGCRIGIGYSAGGTAIWRAAAAGLPFEAIFCVSSTRLREEGAISTPNHVFFGAGDHGKPSAEWLSAVPGEATIFDAVGHAYYLDPASEAARATRAVIAERIGR